MANLILNPSFEVDSNADGLSDNWTLSKTVSGTPKISRVAGLFGSYAQRIEYTSSSDSSKAIYLDSALSAVGSVAASDAVTGGVWLKPSITGLISIAAYVQFYTAAGAYISQHLISSTTQGAVWTMFPLQVLAAPANTSRLRVEIVAGLIDTGDVLALDIDGVYMGLGSNFDYYGKYPVIGKGAVLL